MVGLVSNSQTADSPFNFNVTGIDLIDGPLNAFFQLQVAKENRKLLQAQADQEEARNSVGLTTQPNAEPGQSGAGVDNSLALDGNGAAALVIIGAVILAAVVLD